MVPVIGVLPHQEKTDSGCSFERDTRIRVLRLGSVLSGEDGPARSWLKTSDRRYPPSILLLGWDDTPDATSWVFCVANSSWNEMNVAMEDGLASLFACVDSDIKGGDFVIL